MDTRIFKELEGESLRQALADQAFATEETEVERVLTTQQKTEYAAKQSAMAERKTEIEDEVKTFVDPLKEEMKEIDEERKRIARITKKGYTVTTEQVYWLQDFESKQMLAYDGAGELVKSRRMKQSERQLGLSSGDTGMSKVS